MRQRPLLILVVSSLTALLGAALLSAVASADSINQETINGLTVQIQRIEAADTQKLVTAELGLARAWLGEAQSQLTQELEEELARSVARVKAAVAMTDARLKKAAADGRADVAKRQAAETTAALKKAQADVAALEKEIAGLSQKVEK